MVSAILEAVKLSDLEKQPRQPRHANRHDVFSPFAGTHGLEIHSMCDGLKCSSSAVWIKVEQQC